MSKHHQNHRKGRRSRAKITRTLLDRDKGICAFCEKDNTLLLDSLIVCWGNPPQLKDILSTNEITEARFNGTLTAKFPRLWDIDHIIPFSDGGPNTLDNMRTLCVVCHNKVTKIHDLIKKGKYLTKELELFYNQYLAPDV